MTKMKKLFAVVLAIAMLVTMSSIAAFAETAPSVSVTADKSAVNVGESISLTVDVENAGAVDFTLKYDKDVFEYATATFTNSVNKKAESVKEVDGGLRVFLLGSETASDATLTFKAIGANANAVFTADAGVATDENATEKYEVTPTVNATVAVTDAGRIEMIGATTRDTDDVNKQDLGFIGKIVVPEDKVVEEFGIIAAFTNELKKANVTDDAFTLATKDSLNASANIVAHRAVTDAAAIAEILENNGEFVSHVKNTASYELMGKNITARFYVKFAGSEVIYSENISVENGSVVANNGVAKKSIVQVLGAQITKICNHDDATAAMVRAAEKVVNAYNTGEKSSEDKQALLDFVEQYESYLESSVNG